MVRRGVVWFFLAVTLVAAAGEARADVRKAIDASFSEGITVETSGMHRATAGVGCLFGRRLALDVNFDIESWTRWQDDKGMSAKGAGLTVGGRFAVMPVGLLRGLFFTAGATYLRLLGDADKRIDRGIGRADIGPNAFAIRAGAGYGFPTTKEITIAVRLDVNYWLIEGGDFPPEVTDEHPNPVSVHLGLEFLRWF